MIGIMEFTSDQIEQFRKLHLQNYGVELSKKEAVEHATKLVTLILLIYKPMALEDYEAIQKDRFESLPKVLRKISSQHGDSTV